MSATKFEEWLCKEMPPGTIIGDPSWWAPRIERQVRAALLADAPDVEGLVGRFLNWPLPRSVCSDACASIFGHQGRSGTNLLTADEAKQMLDHVVGPALLSMLARIKALEEEIAKLKGAVKAMLHDLETSEGLMCCDNSEGQSLFELKHQSAEAYRRDYPEGT